VKRRMSILRYLGLNPAEPPPGTPETETVRKITEALDRLDSERARYIAAFAYVLSRIARADLKISDRETRAMERIVAEQGGLPEEQAIIVVQIAKTQNKLFGGTENFLVTREFSRIASVDQKLALLDCLFAVAGSEGLISTEEDNEIRQIADELGLDRRDFIAIRSKHRDQLSFLHIPPQ
jgi:uncharacterized tellurite resistance protein B-like protein